MQILLLINFQWWSKAKMTHSSIKDVEDVKVRKKNTNINTKVKKFQPLKNNFLEFSVIQLTL